MPKKLSDGVAYTRIYAQQCQNMQGVTAVQTETDCGTLAACSKMGRLLGAGVSSVLERGRRRERERGRKVFPVSARSPPCHGRPLIVGPGIAS
jgi:hypothetical protein